MEQMGFLKNLKLRGMVGHVINRWHDSLAQGTPMSYDEAKQLLLREAQLVGISSPDDMTYLLNELGKAYLSDGRLRGWHS
jgi:hypothetical protein